MNRNRLTPRLTPKKNHPPSDAERPVGGVKEEEAAAGKERLSVFCRVRPKRDAADQTCITVKPPNVVKVIAPDFNRGGVYKETHYVFSGVFDQNTTQKEVFMRTSFDLVKNFLKGTNGLLLTYGVTGSGKTFTMNGVPKAVGVLPRCIDLIFSSVGEYQAKKYVFKSDKLNGFEVQSEPDAMMDRQRELTFNIRTPAKLYGKESDETVGKRPGLSSPSSASLKIDDVDRDNVYAFFVTYVEIYNNGVYDLVEDTLEEAHRQRAPQPKLVREDGAHNMYVHGVTEVEVKSADEAFEVYFKGQKKRRLAETALNAESSRSHAIFSIRCVQGRIHARGDALSKDRSALKISQLSLVDLAGSEKSSKSKTLGYRLREAGCINNSLLTLRTCLDILRENQMQNTNKMVPYRESKLTHLFKKYFDGDGDIRMLVCINPLSEDYEETSHVLKFSEMSQDIIINRAPPECPCTPKPQKVPSLPTTLVHKTPVRRLECSAEPLKLKSDSDVCTARAIRCADRADPLESDSLDFSKGVPDGKSLIAVLETKLQKNEELNGAIQKMVGQLCLRYDRYDAKHRSENDEIGRLTQLLCCERTKCGDLENRVIRCNARIDELQKKALACEDTVKSLKNDMSNKELLLNRGQTEIVKERNRYKNKLAQNKEKLIEMETKFQKQRSALELEVLGRDRNVLKGKKALIYLKSCPAVLQEDHGFKKTIGTTSEVSTRIASNSDVASRTSGSGVIASRPGLTTESISVEEALDLATGHICPLEQEARPPAPEYRRSRSLDESNEHWLDHRPPSAITVPLTAHAVLQPVMRRRKSVAELTDVSDVVNSKTSKYCLTTQTLDADGDLETRLFKADVIQTVGGGAQVKFNDVEILRHKSPLLSRSKTPKKTQMQRENLLDRYLIKDRCLISIEGHSSVNL